VNVARLLAQLREAGYWVVGLDAGGTTSLWDPAAVPGSPLALVLGAEGRGLRPLVQRGCHLLASIPMHGRTPSLNVSVAAAIALFEVARRLRG
jgi:23S rRNA (guanosine2251-2'-O)-methyltransferase